MPIRVEDQLPKRESAGAKAEPPEADRLPPRRSTSDLAGVPDVYESALSGTTAADLPGVYTALVVDNVDPEGLGRVRVTFPWLPSENGQALGVWARMSQFKAGHDRGAWFVPDQDDEVLVAFEAGDPNRAFVIGSLWNGIDRPPITDSERNSNSISRLQTRSGISITLDDSEGDERLVLSVPNGPRLELSTRDGLTLEAGSGSRLVLGIAGMEIQARDVTIAAGKDLDLEAGSDLTARSGRDSALRAGRDLSMAADRDLKLQGRKVVQVETG